MADIRFDGRHFWINRKWRFSESDVKHMILQCSISVNNDAVTKEKLKELIGSTSLKELFSS